MSSSSSPLPESDKDFKTLLDRYLNDQASDEEIEKLMELISQGVHDDTVKARINEILMTESDEDMPQHRTREMLNMILSVNKETPGVIPMQQKRKRMVWMAAAAVITMAVVVTWRMIPVREEASQTQAQQEQGTQTPTIYTGKQYVHLPDGSTVVMNEGSELRYTDDFGKQYREVALTGEGYFDIKHDSLHPFKVRTGKITTTVLGTAFNLKAIPDQQQVEVTVTRGKVQIGDDSRVYAAITPDQQIIVNTITYEFVQNDVKAQTATEWKSQYLILDDVSLKEAAAMIEQKYNVSIAFSNNQMKDCHISATFLNGENLKQVFKVLTAVVGATYTLEGKQIRIEGEGCNE